MTIYLSLFTGLWNVCLNNFKDIKYLYDRVFNGCRHILDEEYHFLDSFLRPRKYCYSLLTTLAM